MSGLKRADEMAVPGTSTRPLQEILETNLNRIDAQYQAPSDKPSGTRPLRAILSDNLDRVDQAADRLRSEREMLPSAGEPGASGMGSPVGEKASLYPAGTGSGRISRSLHAGDTLGENQTLKTLENDPYAQDMLGRTMMNGQNPEDDWRFVRDAQKWPHAQISAPLVGNMMAGAARGATPATELGGRAINLLGEKEVSNGLKRFGEMSQNMQKSFKPTDDASVLMHNGKPSPLGKAVDWGGKFLGNLTQEAVEYGTGTRLINNIYNTYKEGKTAYNQALEAQEAQRVASGGIGYPGESISQAQVAMIRAMLTEILSSVPGDLFKKFTRSSDDLPLTSIMQDTVLSQGKPALKAGIGNWLDNKLDSDEWHKENF